MIVEKKEKEFICTSNNIYKIFTFNSFFLFIEIQKIINWTINKNI